jgi:hypothetical protein
VLAEKKAWELAKAQSQYELVTINPGLVVGPSLSGRDTASYDFLKDILGGSMCPAGRALLWMLVSAGVTASHGPVCGLL